MREILKTLNEEASIDGSMVITPDGIMVAAVIGNDLEEDAVAAFASSILLSVKRGLMKLKSDSGLTSCALTGTAGKVAFYNMDNSYLVVVTNPEINLEACSEAIQRAIHQIKHRRVA